MAPVSYTPFDGALRELKAVFDGLFCNLGPGLELGLSSPGVVLAPNVFTDEEGRVIRAEVPGVSPGDLMVEVGPCQFAITWARSLEKRTRGSSQRREGRQSRFSRPIQLPDGLDPGRASAQCRYGMLSTRIVEKPQAKHPLAAGPKRSREKEANSPTGQELTTKAGSREARPDPAGPPPCAGGRCLRGREGPLSWGKPARGRTGRTGNYYRELRENALRREGEPAP